MRSQQRKPGQFVIEAAQVVPGSCRVAGFASRRRTRVAARHLAIGELASMHIFVARGTCELLEVIQRRTRAVHRLVALITRYC